MEDKSIEQARKILESKLSKYEHPLKTNAQSGNNGYYQAYSEKSEDVYVSHNKDTYASFDEQDQTPKNSKSMICPVCELPAVYSCNCELEEMMCKKGHIWRFENGKCIQGDPHSDE